MARLLQKVAFDSGKIIFESIVILAQCKLYTHTYIYTYIGTIRGVNKDIGINLTQIFFLDK